MIRYYLYIHPVSFLSFVSTFFLFSDTYQKNITLFEKGLNVPKDERPICNKLESVTKITKKTQSLRLTDGRLGEREQREKEKAETQAPQVSNIP